MDLQSGLPSKEANGIVQENVQEVQVRQDKRPLETHESGIRNQSDQIAHNIMF